MLECLYTLKDIKISPTYYIYKDTFMYFSTHENAQFISGPVAN